MFSFLFSLVNQTKENHFSGIIISLGKGTFIISLQRSLPISEPNAGLLNKLPNKIVDYEDIILQYILYIMNNYLNLESLSKGPYICVYLRLKGSSWSVVNGYFISSFTFYLIQTVNEITENHSLSSQHVTLVVYFTTQEIHVLHFASAFFWSHVD